MLVLLLFASSMSQQARKHLDSSSQQVIDAGIAFDEVLHVLKELKECNTKELALVATAALLLPFSEKPMPMS